MKNYLSKILTCLLFAGFSQLAIAQSDAKITDNQIKKTQVETVNTLINSVDAIVKITDDQKAKLQVTLAQCIKKSEEARAAIKNDDTKLQAWREAKVKDIIAELQKVLTPAQFEQVMKASSAN